jgi:hypothetical protein
MSQGRARAHRHAGGGGAQPPVRPERRRGACVHAGSARRQAQPPRGEVPPGALPVERRDSPPRIWPARAQVAVLWGSCAAACRGQKTRFGQDPCSISARAPLGYHDELHPLLCSVLPPADPGAGGPGAAGAVGAGGREGAELPLAGAAADTRGAGRACCGGSTPRRCHCACARHCRAGLAKACSAARICDQCGGEGRTACVGCRQLAAGKGAAEEGQARQLQGWAAEHAAMGSAATV